MEEQIILTKRMHEKELRQKSTAVDAKAESTRMLVETLFATLDKTTGIGLAAPQIGILSRVFVVDPGPKEHRLFFINPQIIETSHEQIDLYEGCLSVPGASGLVRRYERITVHSLDLFGKAVTIRASGMLARVIQHELDHLDGVLFIDKIKS